MLSKKSKTISELLNRFKCKGVSIATGEWVYGVLFMVHALDSSNSSFTAVAIEWIDENNVYHNDIVHPESVRRVSPFKDCLGNDIYELDFICDEVETDEGVVQANGEVYFDYDEGVWMVDYSTNKNRSHSYPLAWELREFEYKIIDSQFKR